MNERMLTTWSAKYVEVLFRSEFAREPRLGKFRQGYERDAFIEGMAARNLAGVGVETLPDGLGIRITGAGPANLLFIVNFARLCGGEMLFPGALPG